MQDRRLPADTVLVSFRQPPNDIELRARLRALAHERRRFGYRRLLVLLRWEGLKRLFRPYRDERLAVRR